MNKIDLNYHIETVYGVAKECPWESSPSYWVYRHKKNSKWFAVSMELPPIKLGLRGTDAIQVVNLKCDPLMIGSLLQENGIFPGYHMNKNHWITVVLDGSVDDDKIKWLLDMSFGLTENKRR